MNNFRFSFDFTVLILLTFFSVRSFLNANAAYQSDKIETMVEIPGAELIKTGDVILLEGNSFVSSVFRNFSLREKKYSHAGIAVLEGQEVFVIHMEAGKGRGILKEKLRHYCSEIENRSYAIYRAGLNEQQIQTLLGRIKHYVSIQPMFDLEFNLDTDDKMYCTEFIYKVFNEAAGDPNFITLSSVSGSRYVACDDIQLNSGFRKIYSHSYLN
ncbi:MAG: hypothetical protein DWQ44_03645 [Bacteroidetes bacterium]|nr:MAG: hypothetical protein DWQ33_04155 [Bacteroidota bacterium]REJ99915.1 MAG: hypothetical protein DWQ39_13430 [Bacteroidota bacterium]REK35905.1 MAG: hypothetical protein DWQ44_03645 [Bacteroidota bacterium]REK50618.1 MAG: hypothetical protein DWQ48_04720 [Bacteroidota bacterium]